MAEYIDRDALKDRMANFVPSFIDESNRAYLDGLTDAYTLICQAPAADVVERKTGKWIYDSEPYPLGNPYGHYDCDQCEESVPTRTNFCSHCGAQMEGDNDNETV